MCLFMADLSAQTESMSTLPYRSLPDAPEKYTNGAVASRFIDGLGYRFYWATEGLTDKDLDYKPSEDSRSNRETIDHIYGLSKSILNAPQAKPNIRSAGDSISWSDKRNLILNNLEKASKMLRATDGDEMDDYRVIFQRGDSQSEFPFWNLINGQISDAIYHVGQIVAFRRASGNPLHPGVNVFLGVTKE